jgi:hypothetical protein
MAQNPNKPNFLALVEELKAKSAPKNPEEAYTHEARNRDLYSNTIEFNNPEDPIGQVALAVFNELTANQPAIETADAVFEALSQKVKILAPEMNEESLRVALLAGVYKYFWLARYGRSFDEQIILKSGKTPSNCTGDFAKLAETSQTLAARLNDAVADQKQVGVLVLTNGSSMQLTSNPKLTNANEPFTNAVTSHMLPGTNNVSTMVLTSLKVDLGTPGVLTLRDDYITNMALSLFHKVNKALKTLMQESIMVSSTDPKIFTQNFGTDAAGLLLAQALRSAFPENNHPQIVIKES